MKIKEASKHSQNGHTTGLVFATKADALRRDLNGASATIDASGEIKFIDDAFKAKVESLARLGPVGFSVAADGYLYLDVATPSLLAESIERTTFLSAEPKDEPETLTEAENVVGTEIDITPGVPLTVFQEIDSRHIQAELYDVYLSALAAKDKDESKIIGTFDSIKSEVQFDDEKAVERILASVAQGIKTPIGISRNGEFFLDFSSPQYAVTQIAARNPEDEDSGKDLADIEHVHFTYDEFFDDYEEDEVTDERIKKPVETVEDEAEVNEAIMSLDDFMASDKSTFVQPQKYTDDEIIAMNLAAMHRNAKGYDDTRDLYAAAAKILHTASGQDKDAPKTNVQLSSTQKKIVHSNNAQVARSEERSEELRRKYFMASPDGARARSELVAGANGQYMQESAVPDEMMARFISAVQHYA